MAVDFLTGFEHGAGQTAGAGLFDAVSGGTTLETTTVRTGLYSYRVNAAGAAYFVRKNHSARNVLAVRGYIRFSSFPGSKALINDTLIGTAHGTIQCDSGGVLYASFRDSANALQGSEATGPTLSLNTWYCLDILYDMSASPNTIDWQVDAVAQTQASFTNAARTCTNSNWGQPALTTATYSMYVDDWIQGNASGDYPFGAGKVIKILPGSDGTHSFTNNDFSTGDAGTVRANTYTDFYLMVDDASPWTTTRSATDNIAQRVIRSTGYVEIKPATTPETNDANAVRALLAWSASATGADTAGCIIRNSTPAADVLYGDLPVGQGGNGGALTDWSNTSNSFAGKIVTTPAAGWTPTEVNALRWRFGGSTDVVGIPTADALMLEVDYPEAVTAFSPIAGLFDRRTPRRRSMQRT